MSSHSNHGCSRCCDAVREEAGSCFKFNVKEELAEKKLGRNHDLSVMEYKVVKETERLEELQEQVKDSDLDLFAKKLAYKEVSKTQKEKLDEINKDISSKEAQFSFYRVPRLLIKDERFKGLSSDAKLLYGLMLDRMSLSMKNGWLDEENSSIQTWGTVVRSGY